MQSETRKLKLILLQSIFGKAFIWLKCLGRLPRKYLVYPIDIRSTWWWDEGVLAIIQREGLTNKNLGKHVDLPHIRKGLCEARH